MRLAEDDRIPLPRERDADDESPYLRRQRTVAVRQRLSRRLRWVIVGFVALLPVGFAAYYFASFAVTSPRFALESSDDVTVEGYHYLSRDEFLNVLGFPPPGTLRAGTNIFRLSLSEKRKQVESIPWVRSASLTRAYPHRLVLRVVERTPVAFVSVGGHVRLVDEDGVLLEKPERAAFDFPVLTGLDTADSLAERKARLALYQKFDGQVAEEVARAGWLISEVDLSDVDDLKALLVQGPETLRVDFGNNNFQERFKNFLALLPEVRKTNAKIDSVDMRYHNQIVVNPGRVVTSDK
jgi:cell division protein FtsQ